MSQFLEKELAATRKKVFRLTGRFKMHVARKVITKELVNQGEVHMRHSWNRALNN